MTRTRSTQGPPHAAERQNQVLLGDILSDELQDLLLDGDLVEVDRGNPVLLRQHPGELFFGHEAELDQSVADARPRGLGLGQSLLELLLGDEALADEQVPEADFLSDLR